MALRVNGRAIMNEPTLLIAFIAMTSVAVVLQTLILAGMYVSTRKMSQRMEGLSTRVEEQLMPLVEKVRELVNDNAPMIHSTVANLTETSSLVRSQAVQIDEVMTEIVGIARVQAGRAGILATRTMQRVDVTAEALQHTALSPIRHASALMEGVAAGFHEFFSGRKDRRTKAVPSDETFI
jgi:ABC-type transporter Mla subunit MlaD